MNPNMNLHIESIVLDGIDLVPGQSQLLQQAVVSQLTEMLEQHGLGSSRLVGASYGDGHQGNSLHIRNGADTMLLGSHLANTIYASMPQSPSSFATNGAEL